MQEVNGTEGEVVWSNSVSRGEEVAERGDGSLNPEFRVVDNYLLFPKTPNRVAFLPQKKLLPPVDIGAIRTNIHEIAHSLWISLGITGG